MNIKIKLLLLSINLICTTLFSQKVDLDREYIKVEYIKLPTHPLSENNEKTYSFISNDLNTENKIKIHGLTRINIEADINVSLIYEPLEIIEVKIKEILYNKKDKEGNIISTTKTYKPIISYKTNGEFKYTKLNNTKNFGWNLGKNEEFESKEFSNYKEAHNYYKLNENVLLDSFKNKFIDECIQSTNKFLNNNFGYEPYWSTELFWILDSESNPEYDGHKKALEDIKTLFAKMKIDSNVELLKPEMQKIVNYFDSAITTFTSDSKKHKKMRYASYFNSANLYYQLGYLDKAIEYANKLIENDYDTKDGESIIKNCNNLSDLFKINKLKTRNFKITTLDNRKKQAPIKPKVIVIAPVKPVTELILSGNAEADNKIIEKILNDLELIVSINSRRIAPFKGQFLKENGFITTKTIHNNVSNDRYNTISVVSFNNKIIGAKTTNNLEFVFDEKNMIEKIIKKSGSTQVISRNSDSQIIEVIDYINNKVKSITNITYDGKILKTILIDMKRNNEDKILMNITENTENKFSYTIKYFNKKIKTDTENKEYVLETPTKMVEKSVNTNKDISIEPAIYNTTFYYTDFDKVYKKDEKIEYYVEKKSEGVKLEKQTINTFKDQEIVRYEITTKGINNPKLSNKNMSNYIDLNPISQNSPEYEWRKGEYKFDYNNELIFYGRDGKYKEKIDGVWSEWKNTTW